VKTAKTGTTSAEKIPRRINSRCRNERSGLEALIFVVSWDSFSGSVVKGNLLSPIQILSDNCSPSN
jgi:hypothetical protein